MASKSVITPKNRLFLKELAKGKTKKEAAILAGYSRSNPSATASKILRKESIQASLSKIGLTSDGLANGLKTAIESGLGIKSTNSDALRGIELASKMMGYLDNDKDDNSSTTIKVNELKVLNIDKLEAKLQDIDASIQDLK